MSEQAKPAIAITAMGALSSCGGDAKSTAAAIIASLVRITEHQTYVCEPDDPEWDEDLPLYVSSVPIIEHYIGGSERFYKLVMSALKQVMSQAKLARESMSQCGFFLALPPLDAVTASMGVGKELFMEICSAGGLLDLNVGKMNQSGSSGVFEHIGKAIDLLQSGQLDYCIVGGVDSWLLDERLDLLDAARRIKSERNRDGFVPGEAATMFMLERVDAARSRGATILSIINGFGRGEEPENFASQKNSSGQGLTHAVEGVLSCLDKNKVFNTVYSDLSGESYYAVENGVILSRLGQSLQDIEFIYPAVSCGDVGAASGGLLLVCATMTHYRAYGSGDDVLLWTASDSGNRAALSLQQCDTNKIP